jgi:trimeric autotransporter adhesin
VRADERLAAFLELESAIRACGLNSAIGQTALYANTSGIQNTATGVGALFSNNGNSNTALGDAAGSEVTSANHVIYIGSPGGNLSDTTWIGNIFDRSAPDGVALFVSPNGRLGTSTSSQCFKDEIKPMERVSEMLFGLKPVTFRYKKAIDPQGIAQFGLVAEDVEKVNPDLVVRDKEGKPYTVRYDAVNAMLLNEFLKEHRKNEKQEAIIMQLKSTDAKQEAIIAQQQKQIEALTDGLQKVSAQLEASKPAPQVVNNR